MAVKKKKSSVVIAKELNSNKEFVFSNLKKAVFCSRYINITMIDYPEDKRVLPKDPPIKDALYQEIEKNQDNVYHKIYGKVAGKSGFWSNGDLLFKKRIVN